MISVSTCVPCDALEIDALEGQRGNCTPLVCHYIVYTPTKWLQRFKGDQLFQEPGCSQGWHNWHRAHPPATSLHGSAPEFHARPHDYRQSIPPVLWEASKG
jgi:hypothetical protein